MTRDEAKSKLMRALHRCPDSTCEYAGMYEADLAESALAILWPEIERLQKIDGGPA